VAIFLKPGPIEHLDHAWQPQPDRWKESFEVTCFGLAVLGAVVLHGTSTYGHTVTRKVDDGISIRIGRVAGVNAVAYKGSSSPWMVSEGTIDEYYHDKPAIAHKLKGVLRHCQGFDIPEGCYMQAGYLGHDDEGLPDSVTPNVIEYAVAEGAKLALVPVSMNFDDPLTGAHHTVIGDLSFRDPSGSTYFYDNIVTERIVGYYDAAPLTKDLSRLLGEAGGHAKIFFEDCRGEDVVKDHKQLTLYLNSLNRSSWVLPDTIGYRNFLSERGEKHASGLKTRAGKELSERVTQNQIEHVIVNQVAYHHMFNMIDRLYQAAGLLASTADGEEGYTVASTPFGGEGFCFKVVDPTYTATNHAKWNVR